MRRALGIGVLLVAGVQFVPVDRDNPPVRSNLSAPDEVMSVLLRACYDCHSNQTRWPWYSRVAPVSWFLARDVREARADLNFSEWPVLDFELQHLEMDEIHDAVSEGKMPLRSYTLIHRDARLTQADRNLLLDWAGNH